MNDEEIVEETAKETAKLVGKKGVNWDYDTAPEAQLDGRSLWWPRGKVLGGSSSINAMCYIRGVPRDYDDWAAQGAEGWDWNSVLPWFKRSEGNSRVLGQARDEAGFDALHGRGHQRPRQRAGVLECGGRVGRHHGSRLIILAPSPRLGADGPTTHRLLF